MSSIIFFRLLIATQDIVVGMEVFHLAYWQSFLPFLRLTWWAHYFIIIGIWTLIGQAFSLVRFLRNPVLPKAPLAFLDKYLLFILRRVVLRANPKNAQAIILLSAAYGMVDLLGTTRTVKLLWNYKKGGKR